MLIAISSLYSLFLLVSLLNLFLMRRPQPGPGPEILVLIPARDEAANLRELLPQLNGYRVLLFDDESDDDTAGIAEALGARVIRPESPLPAGWTGKNRACDALARAAESEGADWWLFLDADVRVKPGGIERLRGLIAEVGDRCPLITGFGEMKPGRGIEPLFLAWVGWVLLCTAPFGLVARSRKGHPGFKNGQMHLWRRDVYVQLRPHEQVKGKIMEDVMIGRMLAKQRIPIEVANLSSSFSVRMYDTWRETLDGMSKNSFEMTGTVSGSVLITILFLLFAWGWLAAWPLAWLPLAILACSGVIVSIITRAPVWPALLMPVVLSIGGFTQLRSLWWKRTGRTTWKGRTYA